DIPIPNRTITNIAKYNYANNWHTCGKLLQDIAGGLLVTAPTHRDWMNEETKGFMERYLGGKAGVSAENRLRMLQLIRMMTTAESEVVAIHAEGSLAAQRMTTFAEAMPDIEICKKLAMFRAGIQ
ncbi:MAG: hypothetical protein JXA41_07565, partial [Deltaproteobacteria bacterium]|nr:hypothetical protein [Deltaproteobacteria bacterium]